MKFEKESKIKLNSARKSNTVEFDLEINLKPGVEIKMAGGLRVGAGRPKKSEWERVMGRMLELLKECGEQERGVRLLGLRLALGNVETGKVRSPEVVVVPAEGMTGAEVVAESMKNPGEPVGGTAVTTEVVKAKRERPQVRFGHVEDREDVVKELPWVPGETGGA